ncbi:hypothetical protein Sste5346_008489 [Sporothrix stenoceras]|uniref:Mitochondrial seryl-tRNA synthetase n=1 Tax=Sporothrix stenoceras TaxID=5173 RepID=A0ABR3YQ96_9PEZI
MPLPRFPGFGRLFSAPAAFARTGPRFTFAPWRPTTSVRSNSLRPRRTVRNYTTEPPPPPKGSPSSRLDRILSRLPKSLQKYTRRLKDAPVQHVVAFLILHELTAIVPIVGLFGFFHWTGMGGAASGSGVLDYMMSHFGGYVVDGVRRFEKYFRRKGWFGFGKGDKEGEEGQDGEVATTTDAVMRKWTSAESKYRIVVEIGLAYSITKVLLPLRLALSLWATPWFAGVITRLRALRRPKV